MLSDYDLQLNKVLQKHEDDFLAAYRTHMMKVEKELYFLKNKANEQESKLSSDDRIVTLEAQQKWFQDELEKLMEMSRRNMGEIDSLEVKLFQFKDEKQFMEEQVKASKRQNKLITVAINKSEKHYQDLVEEQARLEWVERESRKLAVLVPGQAPLEQALFVPRDPTPPDTSRIQSHSSQNFVHRKPSSGNLRDSLDQLDSPATQLATERDPPNPHPQLGSFLQPEDRTAVAHYVLQLIGSGREVPEVVEGIERYYNEVSQHEDAEIAFLQDQIKAEEAQIRNLKRDELIDEVTEQNDLESFFLDCIHHCRKLLRYKVVQYKHKSQDGDNLLQAYLNTVKSGDPRDVERFS